MPSSTSSHEQPIRRLLERLTPLLTVMGGGLVGSAARAGLGEMVPAAPGSFPAATLMANLAGSFLLGLYLARRERTITGPESLRFWAIGVLGSFTTFSAFSLEVIQFLEVGQVLLAGGYIGASVVGGLVLALLGQRIGSMR
ncbi:MAG TPA: CrcB family protein [Acidimicrobiia bacterium]|nr:CrcB family protein [Acidimicrobiia bacterium]